MRYALYKLVLAQLHATGLHRLARPWTGGLGAILTLHHVRPARPDAFQPNRLLEVTPDFLEAAILRLRSAGYDLVSLDEVHRRLAEGTSGRPFVAFTLDDAYRDNVEYALPVFARHAVPFTVFVPTSFIDRTGEPWWIVLERAIAAGRGISARFADGTVGLPTATLQEQQAAWTTLYWRLRGMDEAAMRAVIRDIAADGGIDMAAMLDELCLGWDELRRLAEEPLATLGAHTIEHVMLAKWPLERARHEIVEGARLMAERIGAAPRHFAYPVGDRQAAGTREFELVRQAGFATGVTTRPGMLFPEHAAHLAALPRISLNGEFQDLRFLDVLLSGAAFALKNRGRRLDIG